MVYLDAQLHRSQVIDPGQDLKIFEDKDALTLRQENVSVLKRGGVLVWAPCTIIIQFLVII